MATPEGELPEAVVEDGQCPDATTRVQRQVSETRACRDQQLDVSPGIRDPYQRQRLHGRQLEASVSWKVKEARTETAFARSWQRASRAPSGRGTPGPGFSYYGSRRHPRHLTRP